MKNFKKLIKEAYLGNFLNEEKKPVQVNVAVIAGTDTVYSVKVEFEDGTTEKFRSEDEAEKKYNLSGVKREKFEMDVSESVNEAKMSKERLEGLIWSLENEIKAWHPSSESKKKAMLDKLKKKLSKFESVNELDSLEDPVMAKLRRRQMQDDKEKDKQA